ncbi:Zn-dependent hydrolase [Bacillaceae bacterium S4-13-58]
MDTQLRSRERVQSTLNHINEIGSTSTGWERLAYSEEEERAKELIKELCIKEGMKVRYDSVGNLIARREGLQPDAPAVAIGSHLDTVYSGGQYDGTVGVVTGLEVVRRFNEEQILTKNPIELIVFVAEESSRFGMATIGSKAMAGKLDQQLAYSLEDREGVSLASAMRKAGYQIENLPNAKRNGSDLSCFLELHIEQGLELINKDKKIGIVSGIAAPTRLSIEVKGRASHSGTTSMQLRKDALVAASKVVLTIEKAAKGESEFKTVATVGALDVFPGGMNVVPGLVKFKVDIRGLHVDSKLRVIEQIKNECNYLEEDGFTVSIETIGDEQPVLLDKHIQQILKETCLEVKTDPYLMPSGAGHDAMNMASVCPTGLIFVPSKDGISHNPEEFTAIDDLVIGIDVTEKAVLKIAGVAEGNVRK